MPDLFDLIPPAPPVEARAHAHGPATAREAADLMNRTGAAQRHAEQVLAVLRLHPGATSLELARAAEMPGHLDLTEVRRRLTDLKKAGAVVNGTARPCAIAGTRMLVWTAVDAAQPTGD